MKKWLVLSVIASLFLGCGDGSGSSVSDANINYEQQNIFTAIPVNVTYEDYTVKVVDDEIVGASVKAPECNESRELGGGKYVLLNCVSKPSFISVEGGSIGDSGVKQTFPLLLNTAHTDLDDNFVVTPLTTILAPVNDENEVEKVLNKLGVTKEEAFKNPTNTELLQKINAVCLKAESDGVVANKVEFINVVREKIKEIATGKPDLNVTELAQKVEEVSQKEPQLFGLVFIKDIKDSSDVLEEIKEIQNPSKVRFLGLVFDDKLSDLNIRIYRADTNETIESTVSDGDGRWELNLSDEWVDKINNEDFIISMEAYNDDKTIYLKSAITSKKAREILNKFMTKNLTPSKTPDLIISNITTAENAILEEQNKFNATDYEEAKANLKTYYNDKIIKTAAVIKDVIDNNNTSILDNTDSSNTYDLVKNITDVNDTDVEVNLTEADVNESVISDLETNITTNAILKAQINYIPPAATNGFEEASNKAGNTFYRVLAYYLPGDDGEMNTSDDIFVREYTKFVTMPGFYQKRVCYLEGNTTEDWSCNEAVSYYKANFSGGKYNVVLSGLENLTFSLNFTDDVYVDKLNKTYILYSVALQDRVGDEVVSNEPEILVDSFDVVDMFRRMPDIDTASFKKLQDLVRGKRRDQVIYDLNRYINENMQKIKEYFSK